MTVCNQCGAVMVPDETALIPALACVGCGRLIPRGSVAYRPDRARGSERAQLIRALRASRRAAMRKEGVA